MKRMHSYKLYNPLPELVTLIPESGLPLTNKSIYIICEIFAKGGILIENVKDFNTILKLLSEEFNLIKIENDTLILTKR